MFGIGFLLLWGCICIGERLSERFHVCGCPMPDENFVWSQCSTPCAWCDHMDAWLREESTSRDCGPYRTRVD